MKKNVLLIIFLVVISIILLFLFLVYITTYHPAKTEKQKILCGGNAPVIKKGSILKILSWNVQYFAGKNYFFWYDSIHNNGPDKRPSRDNVEKSLISAAGIINSENPDIILLQEVDDGASRTDYEDQLKRLMDLISDDYVCHTSCFYWKALFVPHPKIMGKAGAKLSIISKFKINSSLRISLPEKPGNIIFNQFYYKRAVLQIKMPVDNGEDFVVMNTHLEAFSQGTDLMKKQINVVDGLLSDLNNKQWLLGGDFNLLPPGEYNNMNSIFKQLYNENSELQVLTDKYKAVPDLSDATGNDKKKWYTHFSNNPAVKAPDRTIDYYFYSGSVELIENKVRQADTHSISDHMPVIVRIKIK